MADFEPVRFSLACARCGFVVYSHTNGACPASRRQAERQLLVNLTYGVDAPELETMDPVERSRRLAAFNKTLPPGYVAELVEEDAEENFEQPETVDVGGGFTVIELEKGKNRWH